VYGNVDGPELQAKLPQVAAIRLDGFDIVVTHGDQFGSLTPAKLYEAFPRADIIVFGHTHRPLLELVDKTVTVMNPGGAGAARFGLAPSVGIMELEPGIPPRARLVTLGRAPAPGR
jgi:putative phosphoesterase